MIAWIFWAVEVAAMFIMFYAVNGKKYERDVVSAFMVVTAALAIYVFLMATGVQEILRWLYGAVPMLCMRRLDLMRKAGR